MFIIAGHGVTYEDILERKDEWYRQYTMTADQASQWREWGKGFLKKHLRCNTKQAEVEMAMFELNYGLKEVNQ
jgi:hypothetical protein